MFLEKLKARNVIYEGNIKLIKDTNKEKLNENDLKILSKSRFWLAASIHKEEDFFFIQTHKELKKYYDDIITIIAPRHLDRVEKIKLLSDNLNYKTQILAKDDYIRNDVEIIIINSFGVLQNYLRYAKSVFIGKSIIKRLKDDSGQNPIDAAYLGCKVYHGPYVIKFL